MVFWCVFGSILAPFGSHFGIILACFFSSNFHHVFDTIFQQTSIHFEPPKSLILVLSPVRRAIFRIFASSRFSWKDHPKSHQNAVPKSSKLVPKSFKKMVKKTVDFFSVSCTKMDPKWTPKGSHNWEKMRRGRAGPPMVAQWDPKARTHKMELWRRQSSQNGPQNCQNEALKDPKASKSTQAKMTKLTLNSKH